MSIVQKAELTFFSELISMETENCLQMRSPQAQRFVMVNKVCQALKVNRAMMEATEIMETAVWLISQPYRLEFLVHLEAYKSNLE